MLAQALQGTVAQRAAVVRQQHLGAALLAQLDLREAEVAEAIAAQPGTPAELVQKLDEALKSGALGWSAAGRLSVGLALAAHRALAGERLLALEKCFERAERDQVHAVAK